jgi:hypothetical protein
MSAAQCYGIDYGYVCHLRAHCARVTPDATVEDRMLCEHLEFPHFRSPQGTTLQTLGRLRVALEKRGIEAAAEALRREAARFFQPAPLPPSPGAALAEVWKATPQQQDLFA